MTSRPEGAAATPYIDAAFPLRGDTLPLDHGYALFGALCRLVPVLHERTSWGVHPVLGERRGPGILGLIRPSAVKLRLPADEIGAILPLAGAKLEVAEHAVELGAPVVRPLVPAARLAARFVTIKGFAEDPAAFAGAVRRQLVAAAGPWGEATEIHVGQRRVIRAGHHTIVGFAVALEGLDADASLTVQRTGVGGRRHLGGGIFVAPGRRR